MRKFFFAMLSCIVAQSLINAMEQFPLHKAVEAGDVGLVETLLSSCETNVNIQGDAGKTPLHLAARNGHEPIAKLLLDRGADTVLPDQDDLTPLHWAAIIGHKTIVKLLLDKRTDANLRDRLGETPLYWAACNGHKAVVQLLLDGGANINLQDNDGNTPLHKAVNYGHLEIVQLLLDRGANTKLQNNSCDTALHLAIRAKGCYKAIVQLLLDKGANTNLRDGYGWTPLDRATIFNHKTIAKLINEWPAIQTIGTLTMATHPRLGEESGASLLAEDGQHVILKNIFTNLVQQ